MHRFFFFQAFSWVGELDAPCFNRFQGGSIAFSVAQGSTNVKALRYDDINDKVNIGDCSDLDAISLCSLSDSELSSNINGCFLDTDGVFSDDVFGDFDSNTERVFSVSKDGTVAIGYPDYKYQLASESPSNSPTDSLTSLPSSKAPSPPIAAGYTVESQLGCSHGHSQA